MIRLALRSALSDRAADDRIVVIDSWDIDTPSTKAAIAALTALELDGKVLVVLNVTDAAAWKSLRNLPDVHVLTPRELNAYDVLVSDWIVFTAETLPTSAEHEAAQPQETETAVSLGGEDA
jgi:large subunit ribosomal protein L4